ncbi:MAG: hypothetical protein RLZZ455_972 [Candidatus Parcubacteria bacterium]
MRLVTIFNLKFEIWNLEFGIFNELYSMNKQIIKEFNNPDTLLVVTLYPKQGELYSEGTSGVAMYTKNILTRMKRRVVVFANIYDKSRTYTEGNALILRCFDRASLFMWVKIFNELQTFKKARTVLVQFDFAIYGSLLNTLFLLPFLLILRLKGYKISVVNHHVVIDINKLAGHVGLTDKISDKMKAMLMNTVFHIFYRVLGFLTHEVIVLEETLKTALSSLIPVAKITTTPIGVDTQLKGIEKVKARQKLEIPANAKVILFFGFINWFKGADFFTKTFADQPTLLNKPLRAIIAGGISPTQKDKLHYQKYYSDVVQSAKGSKSTHITGYVPQKDIALYFSAADLVVLPYRHFMTASGVLSLVFSYKKPFIISEQLSEMFTSEDINQSLAKAGLLRKDFVFQLTPNSCKRIAEKVLHNGIKKKMEKFSTLMQDHRSYEQTALLYDQKNLEKITINTAVFQPKVETALAEA